MSEYWNQVERDTSRRGWDYIARYEQNTALLRGVGIVLGILGLVLVAVNA